MARSQVGAVWFGDSVPATDTIPLSSRNITAGSLVIIAWRYEGGAAALSSVTDSAGQTYTVVSGAEYGAADPRVGMAYKYNHPGGTGVVVTVTLSANRIYKEAYGVEFDGSDSSDPIDGTTPYVTVNGTPSLNYTAQAAGMAIAITGMFSSGTITPTSPATALNTAQFVFSDLYMRTHSAGSNTIAGTGGAGNINTLVGVFKDPVASQILLPASDITTTGWTSSLGGALYAAIDESVASDTDYITTSTLNAECEIKLQSGSTPGAGSKNLKVRCPAGFTPVGNWTVGLYNGATLIQEFTTPAPAANTTQSFSVTNAISDYSDLRVRIKSTA